MHSIQSLVSPLHWRSQQNKVRLRQSHFAKANGYAVAEFAVVMPALVALGIGLLAVMGIGAEQISLNAKCVEVTRILARGDSLPEVIAMDQQLDFTVDRANGLVDVTMKKSKEISILKFHYSVDLKAHSSALDELALP